MRGALLALLALALAASPAAALDLPFPAPAARASWASMRETIASPSERRSKAAATLRTLTRTPWKSAASSSVTVVTPFFSSALASRASPPHSRTTTWGRAATRLSNVARRRGRPTAALRI